MVRFSFLKDLSGSNMKNGLGRVGVMARKRIQKAVTVSLAKGQDGQGFNGIIDLVVGNGGQPL